MQRDYTKREFLKMMGGLSLGLLPFISCYNNESPSQKKTVAGNEPQNMSSEEESTITDNDVIILTRDDSRYQGFNEAFNKRIHHLPKYIAVCKTTQGVQHALKLAAEEDLPVCIKSGGHSFEGFSSNDGGMVINLSQMKKVSWLENDEVAVEPGLLLQEMHQEFFPKKRLLPGGSCGTVGIGGLTLGGGYGFFSRKFGLTCDSLVSLTMVAADGKIYETDSEQELLWACKGGGNGNFGVITSFRFKTQALPPTFSSHTFKFRNLDVTRFKDLLQLYFSNTANLVPEAFTAFVLNGQTLTVLLTTYGNAKEIAAVADAFASKADSKSQSLNQPLPPAMKRFYGRKGPIYFKNASAGLYKGKDAFEGIEDALFEEVISHKGIVFQINTLGGNISNDKFAEASSYPHRQLPYLGELQAYWDAPAQETGLVQAFAKIQDLIAANGVTAHYRNYPDINFKNWQQAYFGQNYARLQEVKKKFDPGNRFRYPQSIEI